MIGKVLCVGVAVLDNIFAIPEMPREPTKVFAQEFRQIGGGPAANAAVTVARLNGDASLWARVGGDDIGARLIAELAECGVNVDHVRSVAGRRTGVSTVLVDRDGDRFIIAFADRQLEVDASWLPLERLPEFGALLCDARWPVAAERALKAADRAGVRTVLDADLTDDDAVEMLAPLASHIIFSEPALQRFAGVRDPELALRAAAKKGGGVMSVTLGASGYLWLEKGGVSHVPAAKVDVVDTLAAGDVFHGAFTLAIAEGADLEAAGRFATVTAGLKCTRWGGRATIPSREEVDRFLASELAPPPTQDAGAIAWR